MTENVNTLPAAADDWDGGPPAHPRTPWDPNGLGIAPPRTPKPLPVGVRTAPPILSGSVEPDRVRMLRPTDPRMRGWQLVVPHGAGPVRYVPRYTGVQRENNWWEEVLTWERDGERRTCPAEPLGPWLDPWWNSTKTLTAELKRRVCTCGAADWPGGSLCVCAHEVTGWTEYDDIWADPDFTRGAGVGIAVVTKPARKLPAQYPMSTWRGRFRSWWWHATHPTLTKEN